MPYLLVRHRVQDYDAWKPVFDEQGALRKSSGSMGARVFRDADDPQQLVVLMEWSDLDGARQFAGSDSLREAMHKAGVIDQPDIYFVEQAATSSE